MPAEMERITVVTSPVGSGATLVNGRTLSWSVEPGSAWKTTRRRGRSAGRSRVLHVQVDVADERIPAPFHP
jgi:hypothetical protein